MASTAPVATPLADPAANPAAETSDTSLGDLVETDVLVEEVSIDGMCGVY